MSDWLQLKDGFGAKPVSEVTRLPIGDLRTQAALGRVTGATVWNKFGYNTDVDVGTEVVAAFGGTWSPLTTATTLTAVSSASNDVNSGSGAHGLVIYGIDANRARQVDVLFLNGTSSVVTTTTWLGIDRVALFRAGSGLQNEGNITVTATTGGTTQAYIAAGEGTTQQLIVHTAAGKTGLIDYLFLNAEKISGGSNPIVTFRVWVFSAVSNAKYEVFREIIDTGSGNGASEHSFPIPLVIGEKSAVYIEVTTDTANTVTSARLSMLEVDS